MRAVQQHATGKRYNLLDIRIRRADSKKADLRQFAPRPRTDFRIPPIYDLDGGTTARIVKRTRDGPYPVTIGGESKHICGCGLRKPPASSIGTTSRATASKPLTIFRRYSLSKGVNRKPRRRSVLSVYRLDTTYVSVVVGIMVLTMRKAARGVYSTRMHVMLKRSDEWLPGAQWLSTKP